MPISIKTVIVCLYKLIFIYMKGVSKNYAPYSQQIQQMNGETKKMIITFLDMAVRDYKAKKAYSG